MKFFALTLALLCVLCGVSSVFGHQDKNILDAFLTKNCPFGQEPYVVQGECKDARDPVDCEPDHVECRQQPFENLQDSYGDLDDNYQKA